MRLQQCKINDVDVCATGLGIYYTNTDWTNIATDIVQDNLTMRHARHTGPMQAKKRVITLEGVIDVLGNAQAQNALKHLQGLFAVQENLYQVEPIAVYIKDVFDNEWIIDATVVDALDYMEYSNDNLGIAYKWRVVLESVATPFVRGITEQTVAGHNGTTGMLSVDFDVPFDMDDTWNAMTINNTGNAPAPIRWEMTVTQGFTGPLTIYNLTKGTYSRFEIGGIVDDVIVIDAQTKTATKNGISILPYRLIGSSRLSAKGSNVFVIQLGTSLAQEEWMDVDAFFYITDL